MNTAAMAGAADMMGLRSATHATGPSGPTRTADAVRAPGAARFTQAAAAGAGGAAIVSRSVGAGFTMPGGVAAVRTGRGAELLSLDRARSELGLGQDEFDVAWQLGEVRTVAYAPGAWRVPRHEVDRVTALDGHPEALLRRVRLVLGAAAAETLGSGRDRFTRLARAGCVRPVRWYANRYRAVVWMYRATDLEAFADAHPDLLRGRLPDKLPDGLREALDDGLDRRPRGWRARRTAQLVRDAFDAWEEAAVWSALLGPDIVADAVPDPAERAYLHRLRGVLPPGRPGRATAEQIKALTRADTPQEITAGLLALGEALGRARSLRAAPCPAPAALTSTSLAACAGAAHVAVERRVVTSAGRVTPPSTGGETRVVTPARQAVPVVRRPSLPAGGEVRSGGLPGPADPAGWAVAPPADAARQAGVERQSGDARVRRGLRTVLPARLRAVTRRRPPGRQSSPTSVTRITARPSSSDATRSTSAEMPQP